MKTHTIHKVAFALTLLLFCKQAAFAGSDTHHVPRQEAHVGFVRPMMGALAGTFGSVCSYIQEEESNDPWVPMDDDDTDSEEEANTKAEEPEDNAAQAGVEPGQLSELELLPAETLWEIFLNLDEKSLQALCLTSSHLRTWAQEMLIEKVKRLAKKIDTHKKIKCTQGIRKLLVLKSLLKQQRRELLTILIGEDGQGGLTNDADENVRKCVAGTLGNILASGTSDGDERTWLLGALIGENGQGGLINDVSMYVLEDVTGTLETILASGTSDGDERTRILAALIGENGQGGLINDANEFVRYHATATLGAIIASGSSDKGERTRLLNTLIGDNKQRGLARHKEDRVRQEVASILGRILSTGKFDQDEYTRILNVITGRNEQRGLVNDPNHWVRDAAKETLETILALGIFEGNETERSKLQEALANNSQE